MNIFNMRLIVFCVIFLQSTHSQAVDPHLSLRVGEADKMTFVGSE